MLLLIPSLIALASANPVVQETLKLNNGLARGTWGDQAFCPDGTHARAFEIKYASLGSIDDTALNAVKLYCYNSDGTLASYVTSLEGKHGEWSGMRMCPSGSSMVGMQANVVESQGTFGDDLGMDNLRMECSNGDVLDGLFGTPHEEQAKKDRVMTVAGGRQVEAIRLSLNNKPRDHGEWGLWSRCSPGHEVCGMQTRVEHEDLLNDDAGMCDVIMYCCTI